MVYRLVILKNYYSLGSCYQNNNINSKPVYVCLFSAYPIHRLSILGGLLTGTSIPSSGGQACKGTLPSHTKRVMVFLDLARACTTFFAVRLPKASYSNSTFSPFALVTDCSIPLPNQSYTSAPLGARFSIRLPSSSYLKVVRPSFSNWRFTYWFLLSTALVADER